MANLLATTALTRPQGRTYNGVRDPEEARIRRGRSRLGVSAPGYASLLFKIIFFKIIHLNLKIAFFLHVEYMI